MGIDPLTLAAAGAALGAVADKDKPLRGAALGGLGGYFAGPALAGMGGGAGASAAASAGTEGALVLGAAGGSGLAGGAAPYAAGPLGSAYFGGGGLLAGTPATGSKLTQANALMGLGSSFGGMGQPPQQPMMMPGGMMRQPQPGGSIAESSPYKLPRGIELNPTLAYMMRGRYGS